MNCVDVNGCCIKYLIICEWWLNNYLWMMIKWNGYYDMWNIWEMVDEKSKF